MITPYETNDINETVNKRIARYRRVAGLKQKEMAELLGMKFSTYSEKERNGTIESDFLLKIATILDIDPILLLCGDKKWEPIQPTFSLTKQEEILIRIMRDMKPNYRDSAYEVVYALSKSK